MAATKKIKALLQLVDDPDHTVYDVVEKEILKQKFGIICQLEEIWDVTPDDFTRLRVENLIQKLQFRETREQFTQWVLNPDLNLLKGFGIIARYQYPDLNFMLLENKFERLRKEVWLELSSSLTALEKITVLNHILFSVHNFLVNHSVNENPKNYYLNQILETRQCNPVSVTILYLAIAQSLELPVKFIPYPKNPLLAYVDHDLATHILGENAFSNVIFYINPANRGSITGRRELEYHLKKNNYVPVENYIEPADERILILKLLFNLAELFDENNEREKSADIREMAGILKKRMDYFAG